MSLEHPNLAVLWSRNFKAPCKVVTEMAAKDIGQISILTVLKFLCCWFFVLFVVVVWGAGSAENSLHYQIIIFFSNALSQQDKSAT